jgi:hypothetical protein
MVAQLTYDADPVLGFKGMKSQNFNQPIQMESRIAEDDILYGNGVEDGTAVGQVLTLATAANFAGVAVFAHTQESSTGYDAGKSLPVMTRGRVWVTAGAAVVKDAQVIPDTGASTKFVTGIGATNGIRAICITAAAADGDLLEIELLGPQVAVHA